MSRHSNKTESVGLLRKFIDVSITNILQSLHRIVAQENKWHRYGMKNYVIVTLCISTDLFKGRSAINCHTSFLKFWKIINWNIIINSYSDITISIYRGLDVSDLFQC